jgi:hypothetical protein
MAPLESLNTGWSRQFKAGVVSGLGLGLIHGFAIAEAENPIPTGWLAMIPVFAFAIGAFVVGRVIATRDERGETLDQPNEPFDL